MTDTPAQDTALIAPLTVWGVIAAAAITAAATLGAAAWVWVGGLLWLALTLMALLSQTDPASRAYIAGTLRKSTFTQVYTTLTRRTLTQLWSRFCDPVPETAPATQVFRAALTWRLYDSALLIAVAYPILLPVGWWLITGQDARLGDVVVIPGTGFWDFWPTRGATAILLIATAGCLTLSWLGTIRSHDLLSAIGPIALFAIIGVSAILGFPAAAIVGFVALAFLTGFERTGSGALAIVFLLGPALAIGSSIGFSAKYLVPNLLNLCVVLLVMVSDARNRHRFARLFLTCSLPLVWLAAATLPDWTQTSDAERAVFLFLAVLPLINAIFDVLSYAVSLTLIRLGLRAKLPFLYGLYDLAIALILFLALGATLTVTLAALNALSGTTLIDLGALFAGMQTDPGQYWWLYSMVFLTILPTAAHFAISLLGLQGLTPKPIRRTVAGWITRAGQSHLLATAAPFALGTIWTAPLWALGGIVWLFWWFAGGAITSLGQLYLTLLSSLATSIGA
jgi:hypothetical protein